MSPSISDEGTIKQVTSTHRDVAQKKPEETNVTNFWHVVMRIRDLRFNSYVINDRRCQRFHADAISEGDSVHAI